MRWLHLLLVSLVISCASQQGHSNKEYTLDATVSQEGTQIIVKGSSNLPDKAQILVALLDPKEKADLNKNVLVQEFGNVSTGKFKATLKPLKPLKTGDYQIRLEFSPLAFDWSGGEIQQALGEKGENLNGKYVKETADGIKILENVMKFEYKEVSQAKQ